MLGNLAEKVVMIGVSELVSLDNATNSIKKNKHDGQWGRRPFENQMLVEPWGNLECFGEGYLLELTKFINRMSFFYDHAMWCLVCGIPPMQKLRLED